MHTERLGEVGRKQSFRARRREDRGIGGVLRLRGPDLHEIFLQVNRLQEFMITVSMTAGKHLRLMGIPFRARLVEFVFYFVETGAEGLEGGRFRGMWLGEVHGACIGHRT